MSLDDFPDAFLATLRDMFGGVDENKIEHVRRLYAIWTAAQDDECRAAFRFVSKQVEGSNDKAERMRISWLLGNGTYWTRIPDVRARPWWLSEPEDWKAHVADRLKVRRVGVDRWHVYDRDDGEHVARVTKEGGAYEVWHLSDDPKEVVEVRFHHMWTAAMQDVVARQVVRQHFVQIAPQAPEKV
jgi:hypothetical protein